MNPQFIAGQTFANVKLETRQKVCGILPARIGAKVMTTVKGQRVELVVRERVRFVSDAGALPWRCQHEGCAGKEWGSLDELVADHPSHEELVEQQQAHVVAQYDSSEIQWRCGGSSFATRAELDKFAKGLKDDERKMLDRPVQVDLKGAVVTPPAIFGLPEGLLPKEHIQVVGFVSDAR